MGWWAKKNQQSNLDNPLERSIKFPKEYKKKSYFLHFQGVSWTVQEQSPPASKSQLGKLPLGFVVSGFGVVG